ncbi:hypothetical protein J3R30DRAFT_3484932 [Lentinula aciculospora]|uniref:PX domain-containing protein n=1 Tax=Lentinula aciculospora TaxID=153920 RepID=A0A9W9A9Y1_9AGAR|nr:hypothetical protein J3R30DRAFT_3484932 [Lentinula aciculospora]
MLAPFGTPQAGAGALDGPLAVDNYKRAVYRPPPARFIVDMLAPTKQGSQYSFGMRITPILRGDRSSTSSGDSKASNRSNVQYDVWRRWEDCLWFQDTLELEYSRLARMKRQRLLAGKGVKRDGFYLQDRASSWESLPPGPEPNSVAQDIHDIIPKLTKKGTLFRASQVTIEQRHSELTAFIEALFAESVPTLLAELRADRMVTDFFGYWRRDYDLAMKNEHRSGNTPSKPRSSITSSVLSSYFSNGDNNTDAESVLSGSILSASPSSPSFRSSRISVSTEAYQYARTSKLKEKQKKMKDEPPKRRHTTSSSISSSSSSSNSRHSMDSIASIIPGIREEVPLTFDHNPRVESQKDRFLQSLPEDAELPICSDSESVPPSVRRPKKRSSRDTLYRRSARIFTAPPNMNDIVDGLRTPTAAQWPGPLRIRDSWQTTGSASTYLEGLNIAIPESPAHIDHPSRLSIGSIATFMTDNSADAVIPRSRTPNISARRSSFVRKSRPLSIYSVTDDGPWSDGDEDLLDAYFFDTFPMPPRLLPSQAKGDIKTRKEQLDPFESLLGQLPVIPTSPLQVDIPDERLQPIPEDVRSIISSSSNLSSPLTPVPPSPTGSTTSTEFSSFTAASDFSGFSVITASSTSTAVLAGNLTIKAAHNQSIILLRTSRQTEFSEVRRRIYDKFLVQEKITLTEAFAIAFVLQDSEESRSPKGKSRARSNSLGGSSQMILVTNQTDWERALATTESSKVTVRILDTFR